MTAVEWLINEFELYYNGESQLVYWQIIDKAKEMEKQQIINAYNERAYDIKSFDDSPEEYYNNTYKQ